MVRRTLTILVVPLVFMAAACGPAETPPAETKSAPPATEPSPRVEARAAMQPKPTRVVAGMVAPPWSGTDLVSGETVDFPAVLDDKPAVLIFWATWCPYCKVFMPHAEAIQKDYADRGVQIVTFNAKERGRGNPAAYAQGLGFPLIAIAEADGIAAEYGIDFIPGLLVVDGEGNVVYRRKSTDLPAGQTVAELWESEVRQVLDDTIVAGA